MPMRRSIGGLFEESKEEGRIDTSAIGFRDVSIRYMAGTIDKQEMVRFKRMLFRATRGKVLCHFEDMDVKLHDFQGQLLNKAIYILIYQTPGDSSSMSSHFKDKLTKICDSF